MQDLRLTFAYLSGFEIRDKEVLREDLLLDTRSIGKHRGYAVVYYIH